MAVQVDVRKLTPELIAQIFAFCAEIAEDFGFSVVSTEENVRTGGAIALLISGQRQQSLVVGIVSEVDGLRFVANAINKNNAMEKHGVILSEKVADVSAIPPIYGGGTEPTEGVYLSFSGFPPEWDQAFCLIVAERFGLITPQRTNSIIEASKNPLQARLYLHEARFFLFSTILGEAFDIPS
jgi:hypothetical protein